MLKLEQKTYTQTITLNFREKDKHLNIFFWYAFTIALSIHFLGFILFHVAPFHLKTISIFFPVKVEVSSQQNSVSVITLEQKTELPFSWDFSSPISSIEWEKELVYLPFLPKIKALDFLEEKTWPIWNPPVLSVSHPLVQLTLAGHLAHYPLTHLPSVMTQQVMHSLAEEPIVASYAVEVEGETGHPFWIEQLQSSGKASLDQWIEQMIPSLFFTPTQDFPFIKGTLYFAFYPSILSHLYD
jgi:hypothetical protein